MEPYIKKSALVAELNRLIAELVEEGEDTMFEQGRISAFEDVKVFINHTLEVNEVDLEKELDFVKDAYYYFTSDERSSMKKVAKHFFELGLLANAEMNMPINNQGATPVTISDPHPEKLTAVQGDISRPSYKTDASIIKTSSQTRNFLTVQ